ncbi:MAG TPA: ABC transporter permease [Actinomycetes bacterium]|nr:ABC transporter permease [Actinomycetes bacterium]
MDTGTGTAMDRSGSGEASIQQRQPDRPPATVARRFARASRVLNRGELSLVGFTVVVCAVLAIWQPSSFATMSNVQNMAAQGAVLGVVAIGQMFPLLVGGFDISVGAMMGVSSVVGVYLMINHGVAVGLAGGILATALLGLLNGVLIARFALSAFIVTLGMLSLARGFSLTMTGGTPITNPPEAFRWFGSRDLGGIPTTVLIALVVVLVAGVILALTRMGLYLYSIGSNERAARLAGVAVTRYKILSYVIASTCAGIAGLMLSSRVASGQPSLGDGYDLRSIAVAVIGGVAIGGGKGRVQGVLLGLVLITVIGSGLNIADVSPFAQQMVIGLLIILAMLWDRFQTRSQRGEASA